MLCPGSSRSATVFPPWRSVHPVPVMLRMVAEVSWPFVPCDVHLEAAAGAQPLTRPSGQHDGSAGRKCSSPW